MARKIEVEILGDSKSLERAFLRSSKAGNDFAGGITKAGIAAAAGIATFSVAAVKGVQAASSLTEQVTRSNVVFGKNADAVQKWADTTADSFGISERAALQAASGFAQMLDTAGLTPKETAPMSRALVELASDLASFNDIDPTVTLEKLRSGLAGEAEPLRQLGVFLSEARVQQEAYALGIAKTGDELTEAQKIQARYSLILKDTKKAQGDFARTSDGLANATRRVKAQFEDAAASLFSRVLPAVANVVSGFSDFISDFGEARTLEAKIDVVIDNARGIAADVADQIGDAVATIDWGEIFERATGITEGLQERLEDVDFGDVGRQIGESFSDAAAVALPAAKEVADNLSAAVREIDFEEIGRELGPGLASALVSAFTTLLDPAFWVRNWDLALAVGLTAFGGPIGRFAGRAAGLVVEGLSRGLARIAPELGSAFRGLAVQAVRFFGVGLSGLSNLLKRALAPLGGIVGGVFSRLGRLATFTIKVLGIQAVIDTLTDLAGDVVDLFTGIPGSIADAFERVFDFIIREALEFVRDVLGVTSFLGRFDPFAGLRKGIEEDLAAMEAGVKVSTKKVQADLLSIKSPPPVKVQIQTVIGGEGPGSGEPVGDGKGSGTKEGAKLAGQIAANISSVVDVYKKAGAAAIAKARAAVEETKKKFPELLESMQLDLDAAGVTAGFADDLAELGKIEAAIIEEMRVEGKTTDLAKQLFDVRQQRAAVLEEQSDAARTAFESGLDAISLKVDRAAVTAGFADDIKRNTELQAAIRSRIKVEGETTELSRKLFDAVEARKAIDKQILEQRTGQTQKDQFRALGLTGQGDKPTPTIDNLRKQLGSLESNVKGTILDTPKTNALFERVRKVLAGQWGKATEETRAKIREFFAALRGEMANGEKKGPLTPGVKAIDTSKIVAGLGLSGDQIREIRGRVAPFTTAGVGLLGPTVSGSQAVVSPVVGGPMNFAFDLFIDGEPVAASVIPRIQKKNSRTPAMSRGRHAGRGGV